jgi:hypothetical protein
VRTLTLFQPIGGRTPLVSITDDPSLWLPEDSRRTGPASWNVPLRLGGVTRVVDMAIEAPFAIRSSTWRRMLWHPRSERGDLVPIAHMLPTFAGEIGLIIDAAGRQTLVLDGAYAVPLGPVGEAVDALLLGRLARRSAVVLLSDIASRLDQMTRPLTAAGRTRTQ